MSLPEVSQEEAIETIGILRDAIADGADLGEELDAFKDTLRGEGLDTDGMIDG